MSRIVLGVTGGVAAYKAVMLASRLRQSGHDVDVVLTPAAEAFVTPLSFSAVTGRCAYTDEDFLSSGEKILHVELGQAAELVVIAPATADAMAKASLGIADGMLSAILLSTPAPVLWAPAMESGMWRHPATQASAQRLRSYGHLLLEPNEGHLASGRSGVGRLPEPEQIAAACEDALRAPVLRGRKVLITGGPTREYLDPVRFLSNPSTGRMGVAVALAARRAGADVTLVLGPTEIEPPPGVETLQVVSAQDMFLAVQSRFAASDAFVATAAVADVRPEHRRAEKVKKQDLESELRLQRTQDILAWAGETRRPEQVLVGFAAETGAPGAEARRKLEQKHCDLIVGNDVAEAGAGFAADTNRCLFVTLRGEWQVGPASKREVGEEIIAFVAQRLGHR